jgi:hypothetical protein
MKRSLALRSPPSSASASCPLPSLASRRTPIAASALPRYNLRIPAPRGKWSQIPAGLPN